MENLLNNPVKMYLPTLCIGNNRNKCHLNFNKIKNWPLEDKVLERKEREKGKDLQNLGITQLRKTEDKGLVQSFAHNLPFTLDSFVN